MSATNHTANYELSQYIGSDEPKYLTDYNGDMSKIDVAIKSADTKAETANTGVATNASAISTLDTAVGSLQTQVTTVAGIANGNTGSINTINSLIGNGQPTTTDKTIIGAINEINARTGEASGITYENTTSGLTATNVQSAIDEVVTLIPTPGTIEADDVEYDNTTSGLTATNVQSAIDELVAGGGSGGADLNFVHSTTPTITPVSGLTITQDNTDITIIANNDYSIGKIYGCVQLTGDLNAATSDWYTVATLTNTSLPTISASYNINGGFEIGYVASQLTFFMSRLKFNTNGSVELQVRLGAGAYTGLTLGYGLEPCIYIFKDLGD